jgi:hypothetical protein
MRGVTPRDKEIISVKRASQKRAKLAKRTANVALCPLALAR